MYELVRAKSKDKEILEKYKLKLTNNNVDESKKIKKVKKDISNEYKNYKMILYDDIVVGYLYSEKNIINEIYIDSNYRNLGIGTNIINNIIDTYKETYIYVFKNNIDALRLYKRLNFKVIKENEFSYLMKRLKYIK